MVSQRLFGYMPDGREVTAYWLQNHTGMYCEILDLGATIAKLGAIDKDGEIDDVVLGCDDPESYLKSPYFGAVVGRFANRIAQGKFTLDGKEYQLAKNDSNNHLHGGPNGFHSKLWDAEYNESHNEHSITFRYESPDGEENFPGNLEVCVSYTLTGDNALAIEYQAICDKPTIVNLTNHSYFNLNGHDSGDILDHEIMIEADQYTPIDAQSIPTGELAAVDGTPFDLRTRKQIGAAIKQGADDQQIKNGNGFDHNFVLAELEEDDIEKCAEVYSPKSGRSLEIWTDQPGVQFYTGNFLDGSLKGKDGCNYVNRAGLCLETQHFPDSPNNENFPSVVLRPGEVFQSTTIFRFCTKD